MKLTFEQIEKLFDEMNEGDIVDLEQGAGIKVSIENGESTTNLLAPRAFEMSEDGEEI